MLIFISAPPIPLIIFETNSIDEITIEIDPTQFERFDFYSVQLDGPDSYSSSPALLPNESYTFSGLDHDTRYNLTTTFVLIVDATCPLQTQNLTNFLFFTTSIGKSVVLTFFALHLKYPQVVQPLKISRSDK